MKVQNSLILLYVLIAGCATPNPRIDYINANLPAVSAYTAEHNEEMAELSKAIIDECYLKVVSSRNNRSVQEIMRAALRGIVIYELDNNGSITAASYESKDRSQWKKSCVEKVAVGWQLPAPPADLRMIYATFKADTKLRQR